MQVWRQRRTPVPSPGYDVYWTFAAERQKVYLRRLASHDGSLTTDPVIARNRFTNAYRAADRVSQYLITRVIYDRDRQWRDLFARVMVFKLFNRIETWEYLTDRLGDISADTVATGAVDTALAAMAGRRPIYSAAYIMPPPNRPGPKFGRHLSLLRDMLADRVDDKLRDAASMAEAFKILAAYESIGDFLAYQFVTDLNYTPVLGFGENEFVAPGPGALRGIRKCFTDPGDLAPSDVIRWVADQQFAAFAERGLGWHDLWGRPLQFIDVQNLFCEVDKYTREANPELTKFAPGTRIKQRYRPLAAPMTAWFPPKWGINDRVNHFEAEPVGGPAQLRLI